MADKQRYKPCSFYVPERDEELMRFMAAQSNMSLSMRLLMKAFLASNRHVTDIDVSLMDLSDLIRSMRVDPDLFDDVPRRTRPFRSISAIEAEEARAAEQAVSTQPAQQPELQPATVPDGDGRGSVRQDVQNGQASLEPAQQEPVREMRQEPVQGARQEHVPDHYGGPAGQQHEPYTLPAGQRPDMPQGQPAAGSARDDELDPMSMMGEGF